MEFVDFEAGAFGAGKSSGGFFDGVNFNDVVGAGLSIYVAKEQAKLSSRLAASREQSYAYDQPFFSSGSGSGGGNSSRWLMLAGAAVLAVVVYVVVRR